MVRTVKNHHPHLHHEEEDDDEDFISRTTDGSSHKEGRSNDQKATSHRSKHSETEQRRRSKINERFQILSDLIPQNDQKRDRASFLLEVIQYIQFLQEKLQVYEGTYQGWSPEPTKLMPWRENSSVDNLSDQPQAINNGSIDEGNVFAPPLLTIPQNPVEPNLSDLNAFKTTDHGGNRAVTVDLPLPQNTFEAAASHTPHGSFPDIELSSSHSHSQPQAWNAVHLLSESVVRSCNSSELEEANISNAYSRGLLNNLTQALGSSGVDLSQVSISVQFDIRRGTSSIAASTSIGIKDNDMLSPGNQAMTHCGVRRGDDICNQAHKRPRHDDNQ